MMVLPRRIDEMGVLRDLDIISRIGGDDAPTLQDDHRVVDRRGFVAVEQHPRPPMQSADPVRDPGADSAWANAGQHQGSQDEKNRHHPQ